MSESLANLNKEDLEIYSTSERKIGVWIDGKPLYQRTFTGTLSTADGVTTVAPLANVSASGIIDLQVIVSKTVGNISFALSNFHGEQANDWVIVVYYESPGLQISTGNTDYRGANYRLTVKYTKTTD